MYKIGLKKQMGLSLLGTLAAVPLSLLPAAVNAATVSEVLTKGSNTTINVNGDNGQDGATVIEILFNDPDPNGIWLLMDASPSAADEDFKVKMKNNTGSPIERMFFEVTKLNDASFGEFKPTEADWLGSIVSTNPSSPFGVESVVFDINTDSSLRIHVEFSPPLGTNQEMVLDLSADDPNNQLPPPFDESPWIGFNNDRSNFYLNIDWNEEDNTRPPIDPSPSKPVPNVLANGGDGPLTLQSGENLSVAITLNSGDSAGNDADWWVAAFTSDFGWFQYTIADGWQAVSTDLSDLKPAHQGPLGDLASPLELLSTADLPKASYEFFFGIEQNMNGILDLDDLIVDSAKVDIE